MPLSRYRPQIDQPHWLDARGLHLVDLANPLRLRGQFLLQYDEPLVPVPLVGLKLAEFVLQVREEEPRLVLLLVLGDGLVNVPLLRFENLLHRLRLGVGAGAEFLLSILGVLLAASL